MLKPLTISALIAISLVGCYQSVNGQPYSPRHDGPRHRGTRSRHHDDEQAPSAPPPTVDRHEEHGGTCGSGYDICRYGYACVMDSHGVHGRCVKR